MITIPISKQTVVRIVFGLGLFLGCLVMTDAQVLDSENKLSITLKDDTQVTLYGKAADLSDRKTKEYYYLPTAPRLSETKKGKPAFLFMKFTTEEAQDQFSGAIMHFLMEWGLTAAQRKEVEGILKVGGQGAAKGSILRGAVDVSPFGDESFRIISATLNSDKTKSTVVKSGQAPVLPGSKIAAAAMLNKNGAQLMASTFERANSIADLSIELSYKYALRYPAVKGRATVDWSQIYEEIRKDSLSYTKTTRKKSRGGIFGGIVDAVFGKKSEVNKQTYDEVRTAMDSLVERKVINFQFDENINDERVNGIREAFMQFFFDQITDAVPSDQPPPPGKKELEAIPNIKQGRSYKFNRSYFEKSFRQNVQVYNFNYRLTVDKTHTTTGNLADWYNGSKHNKDCVGTVILNDPFFQHREVNVILDAEAEEMMKKELNYVTVKLRKQRNMRNAHDFNHDITFHRKNFSEEGNMISVTYSKAKDSKPDEYEYKVQWSFRGGNTFPQDTTWQKGSWQGLNLAPPVKPQKITFAANLEELNALGIVNVTTQLRYRKFGKEEQSNISLNTFSNQATKDENLFIDRNTQGYASRLIFTHKDKGYVVTNWEANINNGFVYATIPKELQSEDPNVLERIFEEGKKLYDIITEGKAEEEKNVLDKFEGIIE